MYTSAHTKHLVSPILWLAAITAVVAWMSLPGRTASAQVAQSSSPSSIPDQKKIQKDAPAPSQALDQLSHQIEALEFELRKARAGAGANDPQVIQAQEQLLALVALQKRVLQLTDGKLDKGKLAEISNVTNAISGAMSRSQLENALRGNPEQSAELQQLQQVKEQFAQREKQLAERERQLATAAKELSEVRRPPLPSLENGTVKIYRFAYTNARDAAKTVESLFGTQSLRASVDERNNLLVVYGKPDVLTALDALLIRLDEQASPDGNQKSTAGVASPRSLMLSVFWLADGVPETVGQNPAEFLPKSVLAATQKLGLEAPRLVTQTVNSLATGKDDSVDFSTNVPAVLLEQPVGMGCEGKLKLVGDDRVRVEMGVHVGGAANCDLQGSMATPLGHYMVLGTANSMISEGGPVPGGGPGREFGADPAPGGFVPGGRAAGPGGRAEGVQPAAAPKFATSRFAFVVQVVEGRSYEAEKAKPDGK